jgi:hypothetical protein
VSNDGKIERTDPRTPEINQHSKHEHGREKPVSAGQQGHVPSSGFIEPIARERSAEEVVNAI